MAESERQQPTHLLRVEVPLSLKEPPADFDAVQDAVRIVLSLSRAAFAGHICDGGVVTALDKPSGGESPDG